MAAAHLNAPPAPPAGGEAGCDGKERYPGWSAADRVARETRKVPLTPYRCARCLSWHLGGPSTWGFRA